MAGGICSFGFAEYFIGQNLADGLIQSHFLLLLHIVQVLKKPAKLKPYSTA